MKKILFLLVLLPMMCFGQDSIKVHDIISDGARIIRVSPKNIFNYKQYTFRAHGEEGTITMYPILCKTIHNYGLNTQREVFDIEFYAISPRPIHISENARLLLKTENGEIITLKSYVEQEDKIGSLFGSDIKYNILSFFIITKEQLGKIGSSSISKLRIEYTGAIKNVDFEDNKLGRFIKEAVFRIKEAGKIKDKFLEDF